MTDPVLEVLNEIEEIIFPQEETDYLDIFAELESYLAIKKFELIGNQGDCY